MAFRVVNVTMSPNRVTLVSVVFITIVKHLKGVVGGSHVPDRCYSPVAVGQSGNLKLPIGCVYCSHKRECWSDANQGKGLRAFKYARGLNYLVKVVKEPNVEEMTSW